MASPRVVRQQRVRDWMEHVFGEDLALDRPERTRRLVEKVLDLARSEGITSEDVERIQAHVVSKPKGLAAREVCDLSVTLLAYCAAAHISADTAELVGVKNLTKLSVAQLLDSQQVKAKKGIAKSVYERRKSQMEMF